MTDVEKTLEIIATDPWGPEEIGKIQKLASDALAALGDQHNEMPPVLTDTRLAARVWELQNARGDDPAVIVLCEVARQLRETRSKLDELTKQFRTFRASRAD